MPPRKEPDWGVPNSPPSKKARLEPDEKGAVPPSSDLTNAEEEEEDDQLPFQPDSPAPSLLESVDFYFDDGNLLLQVNDEREFRVHRGLFAQSTVFDDLFQVATRNELAEPAVDVAVVPAGGEVQHLAIVKVQDSVAAWEVVLEVLYRGFAFSASDPSLNEIRALLLLSDKYDLPSIYVTATGLFLTLAGGQLKSAFNHASRAGSHSIGPESDVLRGILSICLQFDFRQLLPMAYYLLAQRPNQVLSFLGRDRPADRFGWSRDGLSRQDLLIVFRIHRRGLELQARTQERMSDGCRGFHAEDATCPPGSPCRDAMNERWKNSWVTGFKDPLDLNFRALVKGIIGDKSWGATSVGCRKVLREKLESHLHKFNQEIVAALL